MTGRKQFEREMSSRGRSLGARDGHGYVDAQVDLLWQFWEAACGHALQDGFAIGWAEAADWAHRNDLIADIGSPAYLKDRDAALANPEGEPS